MPDVPDVLVPDVLTRPERQQPAKRKRLSDLHGSVTMRGVGDVAAERREEDEAAAELTKEKKRQALEKKEAAAHAAEATAAAFARCEVACVCGIIPCPYSTPSGSGARCAGPRMASARSRHAWQHASRSCWASTRRWARRRAPRPRSKRTAFLRAREGVMAWIERVSG